MSAAEALLVLQSATVGVLSVNGQETELGRKRRAVETLAAALDAAEAATKRERDTRIRAQEGWDVCEQHLEDAREQLAESEASRVKAEQALGQAENAWSHMSALADEAQTRADVLEGRVTAARKALEHISFNAEAWHGPPPEDSGHVRSLAVIARDSRAALARLDPQEGERCPTVHALNGRRCTLTVLHPGKHAWESRG